MRGPRSMLTYAVLAGVLLGMIAVPIALAGAASGPQATASASVKKRLKQLESRIAALEGQEAQQAPDALPPNGPAGGDLTGQYPNPQIGPAEVGTGELADNAVNSAKIANDAVGSDDLANASVTSAKLASDAVVSFHIAPNAIASEDLADFSVGGTELKAAKAVVGPGVAVSSGTPQNAQVTCPPGQRVIGGGYAWQDDEANSIIASAPSEGNPERTWIVRGMVAAGSNTLYAWANCLTV